MQLQSTEYRKMIRKWRIVSAIYKELNICVFLSELLGTR